nr:penicillin-binding transpeptidase domain-containing protein [Tepidiforma sp.]
MTRSRRWPASSASARPPARSAWSKKRASCPMPRGSAAPPASPGTPGDEVNLSIGQGDLQVTPLQLANAYSTFVTGQLRTPRLLAGAEAAVRGTLPLTPEQRAHLQRGLELVTGPSGTASAAFALAGYTNFAGKSGTAEDANQQSHALFVAMTPASQPRAIAAVVLDDGKSGSIEAGPIARDILLAAVR